MSPEQREAKAMERLHTSMEGVQLPKAGDARPWLNQIDTVNGIVRMFASEMLRRFADTSTPEAQKSFEGYLKSEWDRLNYLFLGFNASDEEVESRCQFQRSIWNTPEQLGRHLRIHYATTDEDPDRLAARDAFARFTLSLIDTVNANRGKPPSEYGWVIDGECESLVAALLGLSSEAVSEVLGR